MAVACLGFVLNSKPPEHSYASTTPVDIRQETEVAKDVQINKTIAQEVKQGEAPKPIPKPQPLEVVQAPVNPVGCANYQHIINKYNWNKKVLAAICHAESGGNPNAVGDTRVIGGIYAPSCGLFQIRTLAGRPSCEQLKDPETNIAWAYRIYLGQGHSAWSVCKTKVSCY